MGARLVDEFGAGSFFQEGYLVRNGGVLDEGIINPLDCRGLDGLYARANECAKETLRPRIGDYAVLGLDYNFASGAGLLRLFVMTDVTPMYEEKYNVSSGKRERRTINPLSAENFSMVIFPELNYKFGEGFELFGGALVQLGDEDSKFGRSSCWRQYSLDTRSIQFLVGFYRER